jgi:RNA polymerase sigma-70 factor (ECF subfamily)
VADFQLPGELQDELRGAWHRYLDLLTPVRRALHAYCRRLTGNPWDAEDLVQDTLLRAFGTLGQVHHKIQNPHGYLLRTATHFWIDTVRRRTTEATAVAAQAAEFRDSAPAPGAVRAAGAALLQRLAPQERAAVLLKDVFDLSLEEIAEVLATTAGAVKSALHRGRMRLHEPEGEAASQRPIPSTELVDRFVARFNAGDKAGLIALMLDGGSVENVGCSLEFGRDQFPGEDSWFHKALYGHPEWPAEFAYESARIERALYAGEPIILGFATRRGREALEVVLRIEEREGCIARLRGYAFCPETIREIGSVLGMRVRTGLYRYPTPAPGRLWKTQ